MRILLRLVILLLVGGFAYWYLQKAEPEQKAKVNESAKNLGEKVIETSKSVGETVVEKSKEVGKTVADKSKEVYDNREEIVDKAKAWVNEVKEKVVAE
jgi:phage tail tape-measure protein